MASAACQPSFCKMFHLVASKKWSMTRHLPNRPVLGIPTFCPGPQASNCSRRKYAQLFAQCPDGGKSVPLN